MRIFSVPSSRRVFGAVKGVRRLGVPVGNWLTVEQGRRLLQTPRLDALRRQELGFQFNMAMMDDLSS
jgi:hypothetical protein